MFVIFEIRKNFFSHVNQIFKYQILIKVIQIYVITTDDIFVILIIINFLLSIMQKLYTCNMFILKHFFLFFIFSSSSIDKFVNKNWRFMTYFLSHNECFFIVFFSMTKTIKRANYIFLINMIFLFLKSHFNFLIDVLNLRLRTYKFFYNVSVVMMFTLNVVHVIFELLHKSTYRRFFERF